VLIDGYSVGLGYFINAEHMFGIPERPDKFLLESTTDREPYRLFNEDQFNHPVDSSVPMYGSIPYLTGHSATVDASIAWMNAAESLVDLAPSSYSSDTGTFVNFLSEGGALEVFIFGSLQGPKRVQNTLSQLTGFPSMPPIHSLGYHFSKWETMTAQDLINRSNDFTSNGFPVDVLWMDIEYSQDHAYFEFSYTDFPLKDVWRLNSVIEDAERRLVAITDPHIKVDEAFFVYSEGNALQDATQPVDDITNIFIRNPDGASNFVGNCWPG